MPLLKFKQVAAGAPPLLSKVAKSAVFRSILEYVLPRLLCCRYTALQRQIEWDEYDMPVRSYPASSMLDYDRYVVGAKSDGEDRF